MCLKSLHFDNYTAEICVHFLAEMKPRDLKNDTVVELLLEQYLKLSQRKKPEVKGEICRRLARAFTRKFGRNSTMKAGPLVTCMDRSPEEIADDMESLQEIAKSKTNKARKRSVFDVLKKVSKLQAFSYSWFVYTYHFRLCERVEPVSSKWKIIPSLNLQLI